MEIKRKVLIGTPTLDGRVDVWYCNSILNAARAGILEGIYIHGIYTSYDSLIQRSRNSLAKLALDNGFDDLIFVDSDTEFDPQWVFRLISMPEPFIGGSLVKKSDREEGYTVKLLKKKLQWNERKDLIKVDGVGTGFLKVHRSALQKIWDVSVPYYNERGEENRMMFDIRIENGDLISEDYVFCNKWKSLGGEIWLDPSITCNHIGNKKYVGNFSNFLKKNGYY